MVGGGDCGEALVEAPVPVTDVGTAAVNVVGTASDSDALAPVSAADAVGAEFLAAIEEDAQRREDEPVSVPAADEPVSVPNASADEPISVPAASSGVSRPSAGDSETTKVGDVLPGSGESGAPP